MQAAASKEVRFGLGASSEAHGAAQVRILSSHGGRDPIRPKYTA